MPNKFESVLLNDGHQMPTIAFGTGSKWKWHDVTSYVEQAIDAGFSHIDTAAFYETEEYVGAAIKESGLARSELFVTTKCGLDVTLTQSLEDSLDNLSLEYVDLYLIHNPAFVSDIQLAWHEMEKLKERGLTKSIGVSNYKLHQLEETVQFAKVKPAVHQISLNPYNYTEMKPILDFCKAEGIVVEAYSSLAPITTYPGGPVDAPLKAAADRLGVTPGQVVFLWVKAKGAVIVTTTSSRERCEEYLDVGDLPPLTKEEIIAIDKAGANGPPSSLSSMVTLVLRRAFSFKNNNNTNNNNNLDGNLNSIRRVFVALVLLVLVGYQIMRWVSLL
ncbi:Aldo/keto reductase [Dendrothele bispora CBS 962.96]|uniref:Aldo/keto reductase n=1 Tax=Dendrothele bispora (strain CBS 962.96) TaxID=1314807 RepID=A0A4S8MJK4_DENBC|nr:Aldo/keto reductase [Dendrothele bispora CBS 962.96]